VLEPLEEEIRTLHAVLGSDRDPDGRAFAPLADAYRRAGQPRKAFGLLTDGLARLPDFASGHVVAARLYAEQGLLAEGELAARRALDLDPDNVIAMAALVRVLQSSGKTEESAEMRATLSLLEPEVLDEEGLAAEEGAVDDEPVMELADLAPDEPVVEPADLAPDDEPVVELADLRPDEPVMELADLQPDEPVMEVADLASDEPIMELADLRPDEPVMDLADLAPEPTLEMSELAPEPEPEPEPEREADVLAPVGLVDSGIAGVASAGTANPGDDRGGASSDGAPAPRIYTRTLAELYARQGFLDRAVEVFRQLRSEHPEDESLAERLRELEGELSGGANRQPPNTDSAAGALEAERARVRDEELESLARDLAGQGREDSDVDTPFAWAGSDETEDGSDEPASEEPTIGSYFDELLSWRPEGRA